MLPYLLPFFKKNADVCFIDTPPLHLNISRILQVRRKAFRTMRVAYTKNRTPDKNTELPVGSVARVLHFESDAHVAECAARQSGVLVAADAAKLEASKVLVMQKGAPIEFIGQPLTPNGSGNGNGSSSSRGGGSGSAGRGRGEMQKKKDEKTHAIYGTELQAKCGWIDVLLESECRKAAALTPAAATSTSAVERGGIACGIGQVVYGCSATLPSAEPPIPHTSFTH